MHGYSGAGKTALVEAAIPNDHSRCIFLEGKFDLLQRIMPWTAFVSALSGLPDQLCCIPTEKAENIRKAAAEAVGKDYSLITDLVPSLSVLFSECLPATQIHDGEGSADDKLKLQNVLTSFISALGSEGCPVVLFLDDLQWIVSARFENGYDVCIIATEYT